MSVKISRNIEKNNCMYLHTGLLGVLVDGDWIQVQNLATRLGAATQDQGQRGPEWGGLHW